MYDLDVFEGRYFADDEGIIRNTREEILGSKTKNGYLASRLTHEGVSYLIYNHQLVYHQKVDKLVKGDIIRHKNGNKEDNKPSNLIRYKPDGTSKIKYPNPTNSSLTIRQRLDIVKLFETGYTIKALARKYNVSEGTIRLNLKGGVYGCDGSDKYKAKKVIRHNLTNEQNLEICRLKQEGMYFKDIAKLYGISPSLAQKICSTYTEDYSDAKVTWGD
jgi:transposase